MGNFSRQDTEGLRRYVGVLHIGLLSVVKDDRDIVQKLAPTNW